MKLADLIAMLDQGMRVYQHFIGPDVRVKKDIKSPLRQERHASFGLFENKHTGQICFNDQGSGKQGGPLQFIIEYYQDVVGKTIDFSEACRIAREEILGQGGDASWQQVDRSTLPKLAKPSKPRVPVIIEPDERIWRNYDERLFARWGLTTGEMDGLEVFPCSGFKLITSEGKQHNFYESSGDPIYAIRYAPGIFKMYRPLTKDRRSKWCSNLVAEQHIYHYDRLPPSGPVCFLLAGNKDSWCWWKYVGLPGFPLVCETAYVHLELLTDLRLRFERIYHVYNNDDGGRKGGHKLLANYGWQARNQPLIDYGVNDVADLVELLLADPQALREVREYYHAQ